MPEANVITNNVSLKPFNTFGIDVKAKHFISVTTKKKLKEVLQLKEYPNKFILGGGSNMLLTKDVDALVIHVHLMGKEIISKDKNFALVKIQAGENWHEFTQWAIEQDLGGVENLSLIPGNVGTAPIQNIGAYGVELKDVFLSCEVIDRESMEVVEFSEEDCKFSYRDSVFKRNKNRYVITSVSLKLTTNQHQLNISYGAIEAELAKRSIDQPGIKDISRAVIAIRESKLPNPSELGNSGSFFKNPIVPNSIFNSLIKSHPNIPHYVISDKDVKIPAGWLIEQCGFKGKRYGNVGVHKKQALVLVNYGGGSGEEIWNLALTIQQTVKEKFDITIVPEVNVY
ncbi:UDP-N-acetylmuramate dehydrogenase [Galbibacter sp. EGI 63066]|uniref:UDP-N-acetylmuramate dehydrogenase n=1 Tax=Galbibacter sp. EGI 63066 TaxID=2993559 RepID=UPI0022495E47|nr:UDP-N-acetylmuramate dehydrogenase [Galbibacter sp. EGI 63066]MCX2681160.1 UDP-N-acetylmuramate dehydrogenase [Galbibacter sp. EGI 63066]